MIGTALPLVLSFCGRFAVAQDQDFPGLASVVSRDSMLYVSIEDRASFVRRADDTRICQALAEYDDDDVGKLFTMLAAESSMFLAPPVVELARFIVRHGHGEFALSVEGMVVDHDQLQPDILAIAAKSGLEDALKLLDRCAAGDSDAPDDLEDLDLPIDLSDLKVSRAKLDDGSSYLDLTLPGRGRMAITESDNRVWIASSAPTLKRGLERSRNASFGSLRDSLRFRELWRNLDPRPGSLVGYANLRRIRQDGVLAGNVAPWVTSLLDSKLSGFDGIALAVRGMGGKFSAHVELERGHTSGDEPLLRDNEVLTYPAKLPASPFVAALRLDAPEIAVSLRNLLFLGGNIHASERVEEFVEECGGARAFEPLGRAIGGEFDAFVIGADEIVDQLPRLGARIELRDRKLLEHVLDELSKIAPKRIQKGVLVGETAYTLAITGPAIATDPVLVVRDDEVIVATSGSHLREVLEAEKRSETTGAAKRFLRAFDDLDTDSSARSVAHLFVDSVALSSAFSVWLPAFFRFAPKPSRANQLLPALFHLLGDPDIQEAMDHIVVRAQSRPSGARIDLIGP